MGNEIVLFTSGKTNIEVTVSPEQDTVWLTQKQMGQLFDVRQATISEHIANILSSGELDETSIGFSDKSSGGRKPRVYNLDMILSVGYRVNSKRGIEFRKWANTVLKDYIFRGYAVNDNRMKQLGEVVRLMKRTQESLDSKQVLTVIENYSRALELLDDYDHQTMKRPKGTSSTYVLTYEECRRVIDQMKYGKESELFGTKKTIPLKGVSVIFISPLRVRRFIHPCRKRQLICCILLRKTIASGMEIKESQQQCFCIFWTETAFSTMKQGTNDWMIIRLLL